MLRTLFVFLCVFFLTFHHPIAVHLCVFFLAFSINLVNRTSGGRYRMTLTLSAFSSSFQTVQARLSPSVLLAEHLSCPAIP